MVFRVLIPSSSSYEDALIPSSSSYEDAPVFTWCTRGFIFAIARSKTYCCYCAYCVSNFHFVAKKKITITTIKTQMSSSWHLLTKKDFLQTSVPLYHISIKIAPLTATLRIKTWSYVASLFVSRLSSDSASAQSAVLSDASAFSTEGLRSLLTVISVDINQFPHSPILKCKFSVSHSW